MTTRVLCLCVLSVLCVPLISAQAPARDDAGARTGTSSILGRVIAAETGAVLKRAQVRLNGGTPNEVTVLTDESGQYAFNDLPAGRYALAASKSGYVALSYGQHRPSESGRTIEVGPAQRLAGVELALPRGGAIVVQLFNDAGEPMVGFQVAAEQYRYANGQRQLTQAATGPGTGAYVRTDHLGAARLYNLMPGDYYVSATRGGDLGQVIGPASGGRWYDTTYYPGTTIVRDAQIVSVGLGQETSVSFQLATVKPARVSGTIRASDGTPPRQPTVNMPFMDSPWTRGVQVRPDGTFISADLSPGDYTIAVRPNTTDATATQEFAYVPVSVAGADITGLTITTSKGGMFRGRFVFDTGTPRNVQPGGVQITGVATTPGRLRATARVNPDWTFETRVTFNPAIFRLSSPANGWFLKAIMLDGRDVTDTPLDFAGDKEINVQVVLTEKQSEVNGTVVNPQDARVGDYAIVVFPEDRAQWTFYSRFIAAARPDQDGYFKVGGLPPGRYLVTAVDYLENGSERDPDVLRKLELGAEHVTLAEGESRTLRLRLAY